MASSPLASRLRRALLAGLLVALLAGCGRESLPPFDTAPRPPPKGVTENFSRVGVCYNRQTTTPEQVRDVARENCAPGTTVHLIGQDIELTCPLLTPVRATFACLPPGTQPPTR